MTAQREGDDALETVLAACLNRIIAAAELLERDPVLVAGSHWDATVALRSTTPEKLAYAVAVREALDARKVESEAHESLADAERRLPSGRRRGTRAEVEAIRERVEYSRSRAEAAEAAAVSLVGTDRFESARTAVAQIIDPVPLATDDPEAASHVVERLWRWSTRRGRWRMVRGRAEQAQQPRGGLVPRSSLHRHELGGDALSRDFETGNAGMIGSAIELLARWDLSGDARADGEPYGAALLALRAVRDGEHIAPGAVAIARGTVPGSGVSALYDEFGWTEDDEDVTLAHIAEMRARVARCFEAFGRPTTSAPVSVASPVFGMSGQIDFLSDGTIWDLKVSQSPPDRADVLQLLLYWLIVRDDPELSTPSGIGICNPRLDVVWQVAVSEIPDEVMKGVEAIALAEAP